MRRNRRLPITISILFVGLFLCTTVALLTVDAERPGKRVVRQERLAPADVPLFVEDFPYTVGTLLTANGWTAHSGGGSNSIAVTSPGLTFTGYPGSGVGNAISMTTSGEDVNRSLPAPITSGSVYASFLVNVSASQATGDYFFHYLINSSTFWGKVFVRKDATADTFSFGVSRNANATSGAVYTPSTYVNGTTYLVVVKYTFVAGANNDTVDLFVNPVPGGAEPGATLSAADFTGTDITSIPGIGVRQGSSSAASTQQLDAIRVGTSWASVTAAPVVQKANVDMNGDGKSDFVVAREEVAVPTALEPSRRIQGGVYTVRERMRLNRTANDKLNAPNDIRIDWWTLDSSGSGVSYGSWGDSTMDTIVSADFDGDQKDDYAVWRPTTDASTTGFHWINSSTNTFAFDPFGQEGDDPTVLGDYDGDGADDRAVFRCPPQGGGPGACYFYTRSGLNPAPGFIFRPWGLGEGQSILPCPGDYDGDQITDLCIVRRNPDFPTVAQFVIRRTTDNQAEFVDWGSFDDDSILPGDYDGDGRSDFCVQRTQGGVFNHYILERDGGGTGASPISWGGPGDGDVTVPGDYDGDGRQDIAIWRPTDGNFWIRHSGSGQIRVVNWGGTTDYPVANWYVR